jgi:acetate kinase
VDELDDLLQHHSGVSGLCGEEDMRSVVERRAAGDQVARLAFDVYCHRIRGYLGAYHATLGRLDAVVFTAGVGENSPDVRWNSVVGLDGWGITVDPARNGRGAGARVISPPGTRVAVCVVPTDEELAIARDVVSLVDDG